MRRMRSAALLRYSHLAYRVRSITSAKLNTVIMRESTTMAVLLMPAVSGLPVACIMLSRVGRATTSSAARKPKAGFHALR